MSYYFSKTFEGDFDSVLARTIQSLGEAGFGVLTEIDVKATLRKKLDVGFRNYKILGACNPNFAYQALQAEDKIGIMLPCNVIVQEIGDGEIEVAVVNPEEALTGVRNPNLEPLASKVSTLLSKALDRI